MATKKPQPDAAKPKYEPSSQELAALGKYLARKADSSGPRLKVVKGKVVRISPDHPDEFIGFVLLMDALGTADGDFVNGLLHQLSNAGSEGPHVDEHKLNYLLSIVKGVKPRDQLEAMLAAQMAAVHMATMKFARRLAHVEDIQQQDSAERAFNKLARTFTTQMEALKRYRTGGEQKVTVQHVTVSEGGQAIVGNVTQAASETESGKAAGSPPALPDARDTPMPILGERAASPVAVRRKSTK